ncbi:MAG: Stp1/IreP family PP2C-type Ser/Thr phosphatase [Roseiflexus sp.]|jgi:protein phosphatase|nr:Stp1/IreP family PP2C-type Ser/Thr phosphatase [Roseiflexus sp.]MBO9336027.1 Stp1/IreP family PP2C-type Ser/Thr phosphatase [Roseiflexus sp.]MBO9366217.1 Stp1/IreP family PP2C-type Ser/Thr phosphatase [Roseiflexus sp.]MBO9388772.1 Stp1/IreP family PP2C-type Ser/Thr phosphatase [Roseiflexus sp.]
MKLRHSARTDVGRTRDHNEDNFGVGEGAGVEQYGELLIVCDGMGGHAAGEVASRLGIETILSTYYSDASPDRVDALRRAFERANARIHAEGRGAMGTTGVAALFYKGMLHVANVGDSRAYLIRNDEICQVSRDHSLVGEQVAAGVITVDQARSSYYRNVITRALGYQSEVQVDLFHLPLQAGDVVVLCSDGLHGLVGDEEIYEIVRSMPLANAVDRLIDLANERGGTDNITVIVARVDELDVLPATTSYAEPERTTVELPATAAGTTVEFPATAQFLAEPATERISPQPAAPLTVASLPALPPQRESVPRRLNWLGATLATTLFAGLVAMTLFVAYPSVLAPGPAHFGPAEPIPPAVAPQVLPTYVPPTADIPTLQPPTQNPAIIPAIPATPLPSATHPRTPTSLPSATQPGMVMPSPGFADTIAPAIAPLATATSGASPTTLIATPTRTPIPLTLLRRTPTP